MGFKRYISKKNLGDLQRLKIFFENIHDNKLCEKLENTKKNGRNDYQVRTMLNLIYAIKIFGHTSVESYRRELSRNSQLRIPLETDYRIFTLIARDSKKFKKKYRRRTE